MLQASGSYVTVGTLIPLACKRFLSKSLHVTAGAKSMKERLETCVEGSRNVVQSANTAYVECDPSSRGPRIAMLMRYQRLALGDIEEALEKYREVIESADCADCKEKTVQYLEPAVREALLSKGMLLKDIQESENILRLLS